jgi:hypothetical protein
MLKYNKTKKNKMQNKIQTKMQTKMQTKIQNKIQNKMHGGAGAPPQQQFDLQGITPEILNELMSQGIMPEQLAALAQEQGQPIPPLIAQVLAQGPPGAMQMQQQQGPPPQQMAPDRRPPGPPVADKYPAMMDTATYNQYKSEEDAQRAESARRASKFGEHGPNVYGYVFSDLIHEDILRNMKKTQGSFFVGLNLANLLNEFRNMVVGSEQGKAVPKMDSDSVFRRLGEWVDVDYEKVLEKKMGYRDGRSSPLLPEKELTDYSSFFEIIDESKKFSDSGFEGKITPYSLITMIRMLYKYRKTNSQWLRVATVLELIYKYLSKNQAREEFFKNNDGISVMALMDLEEFYNTDHIFMTDEEMRKFKNDLNFYKYDPSIDIEKKLGEFKKRVPPPI